MRATTAPTFDFADQRGLPGTRQLGAAAASVALHLLIVAIVIWIGALPLARSDASDVADASAGRARAASAPLMAFAAPPEAATARSDARAAEDAAADATPADLGIGLGETASMLRLRGFTFDVAKLTSRASALFPFLTRRLSFDLRAPSPPRESHGLVNPFTPRDGDLRGQPLVLSDAALQSLIDRSWSRRQRWQPFQPIAALAEFHSPDEGRVPALLRAYTTQNGLQPYVDPGIRDPRLWSQLGLVADHAYFLEFIGRYASRHPSTKATTELLFLLDKLVQASLDALVTLQDIDPARDLRWTRETNREAYDALVTIRRHYGAQRAKRGLASEEALTAYYDGVRLALLQSIRRTAPHGYRDSDAQFLIGEIYWRQRKRTDARRAWADMRVDLQNQYATASSAILALLQVAERPDALDSAFDRIRVERILDAERARWASFSYDRLLQFGYHFDTF